MVKQTPYTDFLLDPDQDSRRAELRDFFGPHADIFLSTYEGLRQDTATLAGGGRPKFRLFAGGFEVAAFFLGPVWFFYRKMWPYAWGLIAFLLVLGFIPGVNRINFVIAVLLGGMARRVYVQDSINRLQKMRAARGVLNAAEVQATGGVSRPAGIISGVIFGILAIIFFAWIIYLASHGVSPRQAGLE